MSGRRYKEQLEHGLAVLEARLQNLGPLRRPVQVRPFVTLGRETGAGATSVGQELVSMLNQAFHEDGHGWVFLDRNLLAYALASRDLPTRLAKYLPEDKTSEIKAAIGEILGLHPSLWELEHQVAETILQLAHVGHVVLAGRAAYLITRALADGLHVKLVATKSVRVERMMRLLNCDRASAEAHVRKTDRARMRYVKTRFGENIEDAHLYDLVINTDRITPPAAARLIVDALRERVASLKSAAAGKNPPVVVPAGGI